MTEIKVPNVKQIFQNKSLTDYLFFIVKYY